METSPLWIEVPHRARMKSGNSFEHVRKGIEEVVNHELENIDKFCADLAYGKIPLY